MWVASSMWWCSARMENALKCLDIFHLADPIHEHDDLHEYLVIQYHCIPEEKKNNVRINKNII